MSIVRVRATWHMCGAGLWPLTSPTHISKPRSSDRRSENKFYSFKRLSRCKQQLLNKYSVNFILLVLIVHTKPEREQKFRQYLVRACQFSISTVSNSNKSLHRGVKSQGFIAGKMIFWLCANFLYSAEPGKEKWAGSFLTKRSVSANL